MPDTLHLNHSRKVRYLELDALRCIAILIVYFHHWYFADGPALFAEGDKAMVCFFSIMSGFVLCAAFGRMIQEGSLGYGKFIFGRLGKIWPLAMIVSVFAFTFMYFNEEPGWQQRMIVQVFMVSAWVPDTDFFLAGNMPSWFLCGLMLFYVLFPPLFRWMHKYSRSFLLVTAILLLISVILSLMPGLNHDPEAEYWFYFFPPIRLLDCMTGMCIWQLTNESRYACGQSKQSNNKLNTNDPTTCIAVRPLYVSLLWLGWIVFYLTVCLTAEDITRGLYYTFTSLISGALLLWINEAFRGSGSIIMRALRSKFLQWLGSISFCTYLIHYPLIQYATYFNVTRGWGMNPYVLSLFILVIVAFFSWLTDKYFVRPISRYIDRRLNFRSDNAPVL